MKIVVTGGTGYIGSHTVVSLLNAGHEVCIIDNFINSTASVLDNIEIICNRRPRFHEVDLLEHIKCEKILREERPDIIIHFAGLKSVAEAENDPLLYYSNNVQGSLCLLRSMRSANIRRIVFSSSATVYGRPKYLPICENHPTGPLGVYGRTKLYVEEMLRDYCDANSDFTAILLRYFNPIGAHNSGFLSENPKSLRSNLMPILIDAANGKRSHVEIFGENYQTRDGTGERDYIHVEDLASAHVEAATFAQIQSGCHTFNVGTGQGTTVRELIKVFEESNSVEVPKQASARRKGDIEISIADPTKINSELNWYAKLDLHDACKSAYRSSLYLDKNK